MKKKIDEINGKMRKQRKKVWKESNIKDLRSVPIL